MGSSVLICCSSLLCAARNVLALFRGALAVISTPLCIPFSAFDDCFNPTFASKPSLVTPLAEKPLPLLQQSEELKGLQTSGSSCALGPCASTVPLAVASVTPAMPLPLNNGNAAATITGSSAAVGESQQGDACLLSMLKDPPGLCIKKTNQNRCINLLLVTIHHVSKTGLKQSTSLVKILCVLSLSQPYLCQCPDVNWLLWYQLNLHSGKCLLMRGVFE